VRQQDRTLLRDRLNETANQIRNDRQHVRPALRLTRVGDDLLAKARHAAGTQDSLSSASALPTLDPARPGDRHQGKQRQALRDLDDREVAELRCKEPRRLATIYSQVQLRRRPEHRKRSLNACSPTFVTRSTVNDLVDSINEVYDYRQSDPSGRPTLPEVLPEA
jgi:hypothetical protein